MESLLFKSNKKVANSIDKMKRFIYDDIHWDERLILLLGYRGVGKTTLMLQRLKEFGEKGIYFSAVKINSYYTDKMFDILNKHYTKKMGSSIQFADLGHSTENFNFFVTQSIS